MQERQSCLSTQRHQSQEYLIRVKPNATELRVHGLTSACVPVPYVVAGAAALYRTSSGATAAAKVADFGAAHIRHNGISDSLNCARHAGFTLVLYMDPVLWGEDGVISKASDMYSFVSSAWELVTGSTPFEAVMRVGPADGGAMRERLRAAVQRGDRPSVDAARALIDATSYPRNASERCGVPSFHCRHRAGPPSLLTERQLQRPRRCHTVLLNVTQTLDGGSVLVPAPVAVAIPALVQRPMRTAGARGGAIVAAKPVVSAVARGRTAAKPLMPACLSSQSSQNWASEGALASETPDCHQ